MKDVKKPVSKKTAKDEVKEDIDNAGTTAAKPVPSKVDMITNTVSAMAAMSKTDLYQWLEKAMATLGHEADSIPPDAAARNQASVSGPMRTAVNEEVMELFNGDENLSEEFKQKTITLFEAAVGVRVAAERVALEEEFELNFNEQLSEATEKLEANVDKYISHIAEIWLEENKLVLQQSLRTEAAEQLFDGLKELLESHNIVLPEGKVDVMEELVKKIELLEQNLDESLASNIELTDALTEHVKADIFDDVSAGLIETDKARFATLAEEINFDPETYESKLVTIREQYFDKGSNQAKELAKKMTTVFDEDTKPTEKPVESAPNSAMETYAKTANYLFRPR